jgi:multiple sugar transport system permease protein
MIARPALRSRRTTARVGARSSRLAVQRSVLLAILAPFVAIVTLFHLVPFLWSLYLSLHRWAGVGVPRWVGLGNYTGILQDATIQAAFLNTALFILVMVPALTTLSLACALLLNHALLPLRGMMRVLVFLPYVTPAIVAAIIFSIAFNERFGHVNAMLHLVGAPPVDWLKTPTGARTVVVLTGIWQVLGYTTLITLGGLQTLPQDLYEAATIDGANAWQRFQAITLPLLSPTLAVVSVIALLFALNLFLPYFLFPATNGYGPERATGTVSIVQYVYAFTNRRYGEAAAVGCLVGLVGFLIALLQIRIWRSSRGWTT